MGSDRGAGGGSTKYVYYYKNDGSSTYEQYSVSDNGPMPKSISSLGWSRSGYEFVNWNTSADGTGTSYWETDPLPVSSTIYLYAIWVQDAGPDIEITYKGVTIATLSASGTLTLDTAGTYCEDDIVITYTKPS